MTRPIKKPTRKEWIAYKSGYRAGLKDRNGGCESEEKMNGRISNDPTTVIPTDAR